MDQISPAIQFEQVEACNSWENSSHQTSPCPSCESICTATSSSHDFTKPDSYSVETMDRNPSLSRDSTSEPLTPNSGIQVLRESELGLLEREGNLHHQQQYEGCALPLPSSEIPLENVAENHARKLQKASHVFCEQDPSMMGAYSGNYHSQMVEMPVEIPPHSPIRSSVIATTSSVAAPVAAENSVDNCVVPACISFGTHLPPENQDRNIMVSLEGADLWRQFFQTGTEMIITKSGRRMFPGIVVSIGGLDPEMKYTIVLEFNPVDNARYKYINTKWVNIGKAEAHCEEMLNYIHPESPSTGKHWMSSKISFKKIKVTNNKNHKRGQVVALNSMHKYLPRVVIYKFVSKKNKIAIFTHDLVECTFIGVTAYQNDLVTQLKIDHNPFAKAFRENGSDSDSPMGYNVIGPWPPISPLVSPYGGHGSFTLDAQASPLPMLSPSCIPPPSGPSPLPQFNTAFTNWETPPYSPSAASFRTSFSAGGLSSPIFPDHRQMLSTRLMTHESPPISPLLYSPTAYQPAHHPHQFHQVPPMQPPSGTIQHYAATASNIIPNTVTHFQPQHQPPLLRPLVTATAHPEVWVPKNEYMIVTGGGQPYVYEESSGVVGEQYQQGSPVGSIASYGPPLVGTKIEADASPVSHLNMEVQQ